MLGVVLGGGPEFLAKETYPAPCLALLGTMTDAPPAWQARNRRGIYFRWKLRKSFLISRVVRAFQRNYAGSDPR